MPSDLETGIFCSEPLPPLSYDPKRRSRRNGSLELSCIVRDSLSRVPFQIGTIEDLMEELTNSQYVEVPTAISIRYG
jgi:hypothetical protein